MQQHDKVIAAFLQMARQQVRLLQATVRRMQDERYPMASVTAAVAAVDQLQAAVREAERHLSPGHVGVSHPRPEAGCISRLRNHG
ncbi:hypothetical protein ACQP00_19870 [Dactylosporangium sp. CS-047395]|uniref:hypothetical protein n=1 Tax=Dactylosporangium sp. CS-047395 TaxID=3239936 RepID=UPI003D90BA93